MPLPRLWTPPNEGAFENPPGRPFRVVSVETEIDGSGNMVASELFRDGLSCTDVVASYGFSPPRGYHHLCYVKFDGSVTGGEIVFDRMDLSNPLVAKAFVRAHKTLREQEKLGRVGYNPNCGGHIHIDATGYGFFDVVRSAQVVGYIEEPIFRLAGAGKTYGHRTLFKGYDRANHGGGYTDPIKKGPWNDVTEAATDLRTQKRMSAMNLTIYFATYCQQPDRCGCEVVGDDRNRTLDMKKCKCPQKKNTIEWRVWNAQGNPRIMYAWIALMQAVHAYAWRTAGSPSYKEYNLNMPPLTWTWTPFSRVSTPTRRVIQDRLEWLFTELPLTAIEKDTLSYAYLRTPYKVFGKEWFKRLADTPYKAPPHINVYTPKVAREIGTRTEAPAPPMARRLYRDENPDFAPGEVEF